MHQGLWDSLVQLVSQVRRDLLDHQVLKDLQANQEASDSQDNQV